MLGLGLGINKYKSSKIIEPVLYEYGIPAAAYSLRYCYPTIYSGDVVLVRRSSDNAEEGFTPEEILDGTLASFCGAGDGFVKTWYDQSGNGRNFTQATAGKQPKIVSSGVVLTERSKPAILFDNADDILESSVSMDGEATIISVFRNYDTQGVLYTGTNPGVDFIYAFRTNTGGIASGVTIDSTYKNGVIQSLSTQTSVLNAINIGENLIWSSNFSSVVDSRYNTFRIGYAVLGPTNVTWQEIIIYNTDNESNRASIETNMADYYGI